MESWFEYIAIESNIEIKLINLNKEDVRTLPIQL